MKATRSAPARTPFSSLAGWILVAASLAGPLVADSGPAGANGPPSDAPQAYDPVLDSVRAHMPAELAGSARTALEVGTEAGVTFVMATYEGGDPPVPRVEVRVARGMTAQRHAHERFVVALRQTGRVKKLPIDGVPAFRGRAEGHAFVVAFPGRFVVVLSGEVREGASAEGALRTLERGLRRLLNGAVSPLVEGGEPGPGGASSSGGGFVHSTVVWEEMSFSLSRPTGWSVADLGAVSGLDQALVLTRDPGVPGERFGPALQLSAADTLSLGSDGNVAVVLSGTASGAAGPSPGEYLDQVRRSDLMAEMLVGGEATGPVAGRPVGRDSLVSFPYRGRDREGREVRGRFYAIPADGRILRGLILAGPGAPAAAVDTAEQAVASVATAGGDDGR